MAGTKTDYSVIVAGAGFSGLNMLIQLKRKLGITDVMVYEKSHDVGGTWNYNRYPGAACDIPAVFYSYSFNHVRWDEVWAAQPAILQYIKDTIAKFHVEPQVKLLTEVVRAEWVESSSHWRITLRDVSTKEEFVRTAKVFISAVGAFSIPVVAKVPGIQNFKGRVVHTGNYDDTLDVTDKNVVVLGNGCSGTQVVPTIAPKVRSLAHFGRTQHWYIPRPELAQSRDGIFAWLLRHSATIRRLQRWLVFFGTEYFFKMMDQVKGGRLRDWQADESKKYIERTAPPELHEWFIPDFQVGQKRRIFDSTYTSSLDQKRITFYPESLQEIKEQSVVRQNGEEIPADIIISATGFNLQKLFFPMIVVGKGGELISDHLKQHGGAYCYYGTLFSGFPNFGALVGPNTATGHSSVVFTTECQVNYLLRILRPVLCGSSSSVSVDPAAEERDHRWVRTEMKSTIWEGGDHKVKTWYSAADESGEGRNTALYPKSQIHYWWRSFFPEYRDLIYSKGEKESRGSQWQDISRVPMLPTVAILSAAAYLAARRLR